MKAIIFFLTLLALPLFGQSGSARVSIDSQINYDNNNSHKPVPELPNYARSVIGLNDQLVLYTSTAGDIRFVDPAHPAQFYETLHVPSLAANLSLNWPSTSGSLLSSGGSSSAVTLGPGAVNISGPILYGGASYNPSGAATVALTAAQSGDTFLFDAASGVVYTLPAPVVGLVYYFQVSVTVTSNAHEVKTSAGTIFIEGTIAEFGTTIGGFLANGSTHQAIKMTGTTFGGLIGTQFTLTCVSATEWMISGVVMASGTVATPFTATP